ncbi:hypothetical protein [Roseivirga sp.]|uniref:hypothetical protein n=1 Tax=Roseivirga sp. TaxID=1964215 RepID=UPI003B517201
MKRLNLIPTMIFSTLLICLADLNTTAKNIPELRRSERIVITNDSGDPIGTLCIFCDPKGLCAVIECVGGPIIRF